MSHACEYCIAIGHPRRRMLFHMIRANPNLVSTRAARELGTNRMTVMNWREEGVRLGCIPARTKTGQEVGGVTGGHAKAAIQAKRIMHPVYPIGTTWTDERTARAA